MRSESIGRPPGGKQPLKNNINNKTEKAQKVKYFKYFKLKHKINHNIIIFRRYYKLLQNKHLEDELKQKLIISPANTNIYRGCPGFKASEKL